MNDVLPFPVRNPRHPDASITLRMLLTHTSSIRDDWPTIIPFYSHGDSSIALGDYLDRYLAPGGDLYGPHRSYASWAPGARYDYCNIAASLAGVAYGQYGYPDYPDGELRTSARQLAHHLVAFMNFGEYAGTRILQEATVREMRRVQDATVAHGQGLIWYRFALRGMALMGHNGGDSGVATQMYFRPKDNVGVIALSNGNWYHDGRIWPLQRIVVRLFEEADRR